MNPAGLNTEEILRYLTKDPGTASGGSAERVSGIGSGIYWREVTDSTNEWAKRAAREGADDGCVFLAERQTAGKGRRGHIWQSLPGTSVSMSVLLRPGIPADRISMVTLVMGLAAAEGIRRACGLEVGIKWPNDVIASEKKLCGILTEMNTAGGFVVTGVGININNREFPEELAGTATSLLLETGSPVSRERIAAEVLNAFREYYGLFCETGDLTLLLKRYNALLVNRGRQVRVLDQAAPFEGTALGIDSRGELLVKRADTGKMEKVYAGEVSVRGICGYV